MEQRITQMLPWLIILLIATTEVATDMFSPSLPMIAQAFMGTLTTVQLTMSFYLVGIGFSSLFYGIFSDFVGRRPVILLGCSLFCLGSVVCLWLPTLSFFIAARFVQGVGAGVAMAVGIPMISESYSTNQTARIMSRLGMVIAVSPGLAPVVGGYIAIFAGWKCILVILAILSVIVWACCYFYLPETLVARKQTPNIRLFLNSYYQLVLNSPYLAFALIHSLVFAFTFSEAVTLPFLYIQQFGVNPAFYGYFMLFTICVYVIGAYLNQHYVIRYGIKRMLCLGLGLHVLSCVLLTVPLWLGYSLSPYWIQGLKIPGTLGIAFLFGNAIPQALAFCPERLGSGMSLISCLQMALAAGVTGLVSIFYAQTALSLYFIALLTACACVMAAGIGYSKKFSVKIAVNEA